MSKDHDFVDPDYLEKRRFVCTCGQSYTIYIYERNSPYFITCDCGDYAVYDWSSEKFREDKDVIFELI